MSEEEAVRLAREVVEILYEPENYDYINDSGARRFTPPAALSFGPAPQERSV
jgi:hypothetical protein